MNLLRFLSLSYDIADGYRSGLCLITRMSIHNTFIQSIIFITFDIDLKIRGKIDGNDENWGVMSDKAPLARGKSIYHGSVGFCHKLNFLEKRNDLGRIRNLAH